jgi:PAS domain S-box-containing protein
MGDETRVLCVGGTGKMHEVIASAPGIELTSVAGVAGALDRLSNEAYDVLVTVHSLPDGTGLELAEELRTALPVVICPQESDESLAGSAVAAGIEGYVPAAEVETHLLERIRAVVAASRGGREDRNADPRLTLSALQETHVGDPADWLVHVEGDGSARRDPTGEQSAGVGPNHRLSALVEQSPLAIVEWTTELAVATWNPAAESLFGYTAGAARGRRPTELIVPEDQRDALRTAVQALLTGAETVTTSVIETVTVSGERLTCEWYNTPLFAGDGSVAGVLSFVRDVSTEARPVETLEALYETTRTLFRASSRGAVAERIVDVAREALGGATVDIRLHDVDQHALVDTGAASPDPLPFPPIQPGSTLWRPYETGEPMTIKRVDALDAEWASETDVESLACYPLDHHGILVFGLPSADILGPELHRVGNVLATTATAALDRAERERSLRRSQTIVEAIGDGVYAADRDGNLLAVNDTLVSMTGYARTRLERGHLSVILDEESVERSQHLVKELVDTDVGATTASAEFDLETSDGRRLPCDVTLSPLIEDGEFVGIVGILRDVSEHKHMQAELNAHRKKIDAIHDGVTRLEACEDVQMVLDTAVDAAEHLFDFDVCSIAEHDETYDRLHVRAMSTEAVVFDRDEVRTLDSGIDARAFESGERQIVTDLETRPDDQPIDGRFRSATAIPIGDFGVFRIVATPPDAFDETDARLAELLVSHVEHALEKLDSESEAGEDRDRFDDLFESIPDPVVVLREDDGRAVVTDANPAFERVFDHERETVVDEPLAESFAPVDDDELPD